MKNTRRKFLRDCTAISVVSALAPASVLANAAATPEKNVLPGHLPGDEFISQLNTIFRIDAGRRGIVHVRLDEVRHVPGQAVRPGRGLCESPANASLSLFFVGRRSELLAQDTYSFEHDALGRFELFIVPVFTRNPEKIDYHAVIFRRGEGVSNLTV
jgi:hypothetical protein